jgi:hypothetical protein
MDEPVGTLPKATLPRSPEDDDPTTTRSASWSAASSIKPLGIEVD